MRRVWRVVRWFAVPLLTLLVLVAILCVYAFVSWRADPDPSHTSVGPNAIWLEHRWVEEDLPAHDYAALVTRLRRGAFTDIFFHTGPLEADGSIPRARFRRAPDVLRYLDEHLAGVRAQAWLGQVEERGGGPLDLDDDAVRHGITSTARALLDLGFDGIHLDIEPIYPDDEDFLALLGDVAHVTDRRNAVLSVAGEELEYFSGAGRVLRIFSDQAHPWTRNYYAEVAQRVDQIAVMMYDTAMPTDWLYGLQARTNTRNLVDLVGGDVTLFIGLPTYEDENIGFHPSAENIESGIRAVQQGLQGFDEEELEHFGLAIYAEWTTEGDEWSVYLREWLGVSEPRASAWGTG